MCATSVSEASVEGSWIQRKDDDLCLYIVSDPPPVSPSLYDLNILHVHCFMASIWPNLYTDTPPIVRKNFGTNFFNCFIVFIAVWLVMFAARPDLC